MEDERHNPRIAAEELVTSRISTEEFARGSARRTGNAGEKSGGSPILDASGETLAGDASSFSTGLNRRVEKNPMLAMAISAGVGLLVGMVIGAAVARD